MNKKGFTLIELLAVLVVLAILALISVPITIRIINNARENSAKRSIENYGKAVELAVGNILLEKVNTDYNELSNLYKNNNLNINYTGQEVTCNSLKIGTNNDIILRGCHTSNSKTYKYQDRHVTLQQDTYSIGDPITVNGIDFYVIKNSPVNQDYVVALKKDPLTVREVNTYGGVGTEENHVNEYLFVEVGKTAYDIQYWDREEKRNKSTGYGGMAYYSSNTCKIVLENNQWVTYYEQCKNDYDNSEIKYVVDNWESVNFPNNELIKIDDKTTRLITKEEYDLLYSGGNNWRYNSKYWYWTMTPDRQNRVWYIANNGSCGVGGNGILNYSDAVRPVINVKKSAIE